MMLRAIERYTGIQTFLLVGTFLLVSTFAWPQEESTNDRTKQYSILERDGRPVVDVSLADLLKITLRENLTLEISRKEEEIARNTLENTREGSLPTLASSATQKKIVSGSGSGDTFLTATQSESLELSTTLSKTDHYGIKYGVTMRETRSRSQTLTAREEGDTPSSGGFGDWFHTNALTGSVTIPFFQDWGKEFNYNVPVRIAEIGLKQTQLSTKQNKLNLLKTVATHYWDLVGIIETIKVQKEAVRLSEQLLKDNLLQLQAGVISKTDIQPTETQLAQERQSLLSSQIQVFKLENQIRIALNLTDHSFGFYPIDAPTVHSEEIQYQTELKKIFQNNPDLKILETNLKKNEQETIREFNKDKTNLDLALSYTLTGHGSSPFRGTSEYGETQYHGYNAQLTWTVPLFDQITPRNIEKKQLEKQKIQVQINHLKSELSVRLQTALLSLRLALQKVKTAEIVTNLAKEQFENELVRFKLGQSTSYKLAQLKSQITDGQKGEIQASIEYEKAFLDLLVLTNDIFEYYHLPQS